MLCDRWIHPASGRIYSYAYKAPKVAGKDDTTGEPLVQRDDDKPESVRMRLASYDAVTSPLIRYYEEKGVLKTFAGTMSDVIYPQVKDWLANEKNLWDSIFSICSVVFVRLGTLLHMIRWVSRTHTRSQNHLKECLSNINVNVYYIAYRLSTRKVVLPIWISMIQSFPPSMRLFGSISDRSGDFMINLYFLCDESCARDGCPVIYLMGNVYHTAANADVWPAYIVFKLLSRFSRIKWQQHQR